MLGLRAGKFLLGLVLLPAACGLTGSLVDLLLGLPSRPGGLPPGLWWFGGGAVLWLILWIALPRPARTYVLAHELTHALWGLAMGARVSKLRVRADGGSVNLTKTNVWITLAPYFFPLYTILVILVRGLLHLLFPAMADYELFWLALVGLTWAFHLTFTVAVLLQRQPDVQEHGRLFSWVLIYLLNVLGLLVWILAVTQGDWLAAAANLLHHLVAAYAQGAAGLGRLFSALWRFMPFPSRN